MNFETENTEFKVGFTSEIYKEVVAFANTDGGIIYIGIDNQGNTVGLADVDDEYTRITNGIRDAIMPDVTMFVHYTLQENKVVRISVSEGTNKPYYLKAKGLRPSGVYVRHGASSAPASAEQIRQMIKDSDGDVYEEMRSLNQELTFEAAADSFKRYGVEFEEKKYAALGMVALDDRIFTNLAYILSDQCEHTIKIAVFGDDANTVFKDNKEFSGSILKQLDNAFAYLMLCNRTVSTFQGLERFEKSDYPEEAIREALLNALVHRDYGFSGSIIINVNENQMEFISIGGLLSGLTTEDIRSGISQPRNKKLAEVFHRLHLIESYGTGIRKIYSLYADCTKQPRIEVTANTFKMILPNRNTASESGKIGTYRNKVTSQMEKVLEYIDKNGKITEPQVQELLNLKRTRSYTLMKQLSDAGAVSVMGRGAGKYYIRR